MIEKENLVYISLPVAKILADKDKKINDLQEQNMDLECKVMNQEELNYIKTKPIDDPYEFY